MSPATPIPVRGVSLRFQRKQLEQRRDELKRKASTISSDDSPVEYRKIRMEELRHERDEFLLEKDFLDEEKKERKLDDKQYRKAPKLVNFRVISLGSQLWQEAQSLREEEIRAGISLPVGPDSQGAFIDTLLAVWERSF
ncbi:hypothetical protein MMC21_008037 [Puttea exsequens]|nr:hypothetical protein [Puttea exsequens]